MAKVGIKKGATDVSLLLFIQDATETTGVGLAGLAYNSAGLVCYYCRPGSAAAQLTLATQTVTGSHSDGGFVEVHATNMPGVYRLDLSDAIVASGVNSVALLLHGATDMAPVPIEIELLAYDPQDVVRMGLTALPNAAAEAAGGLFTRGTGAGQINQPANGLIDANVERWNNTSVPAEHSAGYPIVTVKDGSGTGEINTNGGKVVGVELVDTLTTYTGNTPQTGDAYARIGANGAGLSAVPWNAAWDTEVQSEVDDAIKALHLDHLVVDTGTVIDLGANTTIYFDATLANNTATAQHSGNILVFTSGANNRTSKRINILNASGSADVGVNLYDVTAERLPVAPSAGDTFVIFALRDEKMRGTDSAAQAAFYTSTRAGYLDLLNTNLDATVSSRATQTSVDDLPTNAELGTALAAADDATLAAVAAVQTTVDDIPTNAELAAALATADDATLAAIAALDAKVDTVDTVADGIKAKTDLLAFTGGDVHATLDGEAVTVGTNNDKTGYALTSAERNSIADALLVRDVDQVEASAALHSLASVILKTVSRTRKNGAAVETFRTDGTTLHLSQPITQDATLDPITEYGVGV